MRIIFCLPGKTFTDTFLQSWTNLIVRLNDWNIGGIEFGLSSAYDPVVYYARNRCLGGDLMAGPNQLPWQGRPYDYMMWIDSDMVFSPEQFFKLLDHDKDVVSGLYMMTDLQHFATVEKWDEDYFKQNGHFEFVKRTDWMDRKGLVSVDYTGFGWILIKKGVFESIRYPWFRPEWREFPFDPPVKEFTSEDVSVCHLIKKNGWDIFVDPEIVIGHEKMMVL